MTADGSFAPNYQDGLCTLACCKPQIRRSVGKAVLAAADKEGLPDLGRLRA
jgi:hypothetical protein